ncbi:hypothetical protein MPLDJ20_120116 [Mesorhizobium plurifarium]|uniref:Uncharacterized protein n=1 Tax=Mesorhizobium plurifarium TaxID=69974 RepID=A0A090G3J5_MESPL|nr:hypothetical protein MPLDJ20_120116 [Mesorhizobium plurifarium]
MPRPNCEEQFGAIRPLPEGRGACRRLRLPLLPSGEKVDRRDSAETDEGAASTLPSQVFQRLTNYFPARLPAS